jgi:hypothetical protein
VKGKSKLTAVYIAVPVALAVVAVVVLLLCFIIRREKHGVGLGMNLLRRKYTSSVLNYKMHVLIFLYS